MLSFAKIGEKDNVRETITWMRVEGEKEQKLPKLLHILARALWIKRLHMRLKMN
jgi:hypothetical protein